MPFATARRFSILATPPSAIRNQSCPQPPLSGVSRILARVRTSHSAPIFPLYKHRPKVWPDSTLSDQREARAVPDCKTARQESLETAASNEGSALARFFVPALLQSGLAKRSQKTGIANADRQPRR